MGIIVLHIAFVRCRFSTMSRARRLRCASSNYPLSLSPLRTPPDCRVAAAHPLPRLLALYLQSYVVWTARALLVAGSFPWFVLFLVHAFIEFPFVFHAVCDFLVADFVYIWLSCSPFLLSIHRCFSIRYHIQICIHFHRVLLS